MERLSIRLNWFSVSQSIQRFDFSFVFYQMLCSVFAQHCRVKFAENEIEFRLVKKEGMILVQWSPSKHPKPN